MSMKDFSLQKRIGNRVKELRAKTELSQEQLGLQAGLDRTYINSVENGRRNVSVNTLAKISYALGASLTEDLITEE